MEQNSTRCHSSAGQDPLYIETEKAKALKQAEYTEKTESAEGAELSVKECCLRVENSR